MMGSEVLKGVFGFVFLVSGFRGFGFLKGFGFWGLGFILQGSRVRGLGSGFRRGRRSYPMGPREACCPPNASLALPVFSGSPCTVGFGVQGFVQVWIEGWI